MNFLKTIRNSIYSPQFYSTVLTKSFKSSLGYFLLLILFLTIIRIIFLIKPLLLDTPVQLMGFLQEMVYCYPKDLEVKITNGAVSINAEEPYLISSCEGGVYLAVIDTKTPFSPKKFDEYGKVAVWVTQNEIVYKKSNVETRTYSLAQVKDFKLNQQVLNSFYQKFSPYLKFVGPILLILSFLGIYLSYNLRLIQLFVVAALILVFGKIFKQNLGFWQSYKLGLYAITLGLIVDLVVNLTGRWTGIYGFPFMVTILTLAVVLLNLILPKKGQNS